MMKRFTVDGSAELEKKIASHMEIIAAESEKIFRKEDLCAIVLGGGYGRGEGGVLRIDGTQTTFNDYDLFVITEGLSKAQKKEYHKKMNDLSKQLTSRFGIDVDFAFPLNRDEISRLPFTQMWGELKKGHFVISGLNDILSLYRFNDLNRLPVSEAAKLLLNRGTGLLLARKRIEKCSADKKERISAEDSDFISRNTYKAVIGVGDAILIEKGIFHHSYVKRRDLLLMEKDVSDEMKSFYSRAIEFKLSPFLEKDLNMLKNIHGLVTELFREPFYRIREKTVCDRNYIKNILINIREFGIFQNLGWMFLYPRERLLFVMPFFLFEDGTRSFEDVRKALNIRRNGHNVDMFEHFIIIWSKFN